MEPQYSENPGKNLFTLQTRKDGPSYVIRSNFDSGNIGRLEIGLNSAIVITPANDCMGTEFESHSKGWFYFAFSGHQVGSKIKFVIKRMNQLGSQVLIEAMQGKFTEYFKPVYRYSDGPWERVDQAITFNRQDDVQLHFQFKFEKKTEVYFAYSYPFSVKECEKLLMDLKNQAKGQKRIYYHDEVVIKSPEGRPLHLLTISSPDSKMNSRESPVDEKLFLPDKPRAFKFSQNKKIVFISARVHPGEAPSSHTMNGVLKFLLSKDARAETLRQNFVFKIVPMLNPDGVYHGHYRMDCFNQNLNRFYLNPDPFKQPSAYAVKRLGQYYKLQDRLCFYMDLHSHPQRKGNFIYGNSVEDQDEQIETQLFPKLLSMNCVEFEYENSCFSKNHMTMKDRNEDLSKEGCGRVVFNRDLGQIYSYTMECGYTCSGYLNQLSALTNPHRKFDRLGVVHEELDNIKSGYYSGNKPPYFTIRSYENLGKSIMVSILDLFNLNKYSRIPNSCLKDLDGVRLAIKEQLNKANRDFKVYSNNKQQINFNVVKRIDRRKNNQTFMTGKSLPKATIGSQLMEKKVFSSKIIERQKRTQESTDRRRTLPKMRVHK